MADISTELARILAAIYGEDVRGSIHDAIEKINNVSEVVLTTGTAVTNPSSSSTGFYDDSLYLNTDTFELWKCTGVNTWASQGTLKGEAGDDGNGIVSIAKTATSGLVDTYTITYTDGTTSTFTVTNGEDGANGNKWYRGTGISGKAALPTVYTTSGVADANSGDMFLNPSEGAFYSCVTGGIPTVATWQYEMTIGDMSHTDYDSDYDVKTAGGIKAYVSGAIAGKQDTLTFDNVPTNGSNNPVKSDGIYDAISDVYGVMDENGAKNRLIFPYKDTTKSNNGITVTVLDDGTLKIDTAGAMSIGNLDFYLWGDYASNTEKLLPNGEYSISCNGLESNKIIILGGKTNTDSYLIASSPDTQDFTVDNTNYITYLFMRVYGGQIIDNLVIKPLITVKGDTNRTFQPYAMTNKELTDAVTPVESGVTDIVEGASIWNEFGNHLAKIGHVVYATVAITGITSEAWATICKVPAGYTPKYAQRIKLYGNTDIMIGTNGGISSPSALNNATLVICASWYIG